MTPNEFRKIALGFDGAVEKAHMGHPDFRAANGKIFATLHTDRKHGMVKLTLDQQRRFVADCPDAFSPAAGAWGLAGATIVTLAAIESETLGEAMTAAWGNLQQVVISRPSSVTSRKSSVTRRQSSVSRRRRRRSSNS